MMMGKMEKQQLDDKMKKITGEELPLSIPYIVYENSENRHERKEKRLLLWVIIPLILAFFLSNMAWLYVFQSYDYVTEEITVDSADGGNANYIGNDGDIHNGTSEDSKKE